MKTEIVKIKIIHPNGGSTCWYNEHVGETFLATKCDAESGEEVYEGFEMYRILDSEPIVAEKGIGPLYVCKELDSDYSEYEVIEEPKKFTAEEVKQIATWSFHFYKTNEYSDSELEEVWEKLLEERLKRK